MAFEDNDREGAFFVNREAELAWIAQRALGRNTWATTIEISGLPGIGKTALVQQFLRVHSLQKDVLSVTNYGTEIDLDRLDYSLRNLRRKSASIVILDDADLTDKDVERAVSAVFNWKAIRTLFVTQRRPAVGKRVDLLRLGPLDERSTLSLFRRLLGRRSSEIPRSVLDMSDGHPLAIHLIARLLQTHDPDGLVRLLQGSLYDLENNVFVPRRELISSVRPQLVLANEQILQRLKARPEDIHQIGHRKFEELIAELLADMDFDVELTPATRDGGRDVLAYWNSPIGRLLCLVEAKKHRPDRPVGIQLVRNLYGTLMDEQATSGMLVTTSDFSSEARKFEKKHQWQLALKNYTDLVEWIENYKKPKPKSGLRLQ